MNRSFTKKREDSARGTPRSDKFSLGDLDLINLRLNSPQDKSEALGSRDKGSGDSFSPSTHRHPLEKIKTSLLRPDPSKVPQGYSSKPQKLSHYSSDSLLLLYSKEKSNQVIRTGPINKEDFLYPSKKKTRTRIIDIIPEYNITPSQHSKPEKSISATNFPFKLTPSGNFKVNSSQVVFASDKLSLLVADPQNTKINFQPELLSSDNSKMTHHEPPDFLKNSPMETIMSQAGFSSLGSLIGQSPPRTTTLEPSEYESKKTSEILEPELNLGRLGYTGSEPINWDKIKLPEKVNLYLELYHRITNNTNADCKVYIDNEEFNCHLIVLQCYSELFDAYVAVKKVELPADKCSVSAFSFIYDWMITGEPSYIHLNRENVLDIFNSAKYLKIKDLVEQCWAFIDNIEVFNEDTGFLLYMDAKKKNLPEVKELMLPRIQDFFLMLVSSQDWLELEIDDVKNLLRSNYIRLTCEMEAFMSAVRWLKYDYQTRDKFKLEVLECIRFGNIAPWQLVDIKRNPENPEFMELAKDPRVCKMIDDGLAYGIIKYWYGQNNQDFEHWNTILALKEPGKRNWTGNDEGCLTYRAFVIHLDQYRRSQLIEKNKPRITDKADKKHIKIKDDKFNNSDKNNLPKIPTMEEFMSKKNKEKKLGINAYFNKLKNTSENLENKINNIDYFSEDTAAKVIQSAFRKYKRNKQEPDTGKCVSNKKVNNHLNMRRSKKVLDMFSASQNIDVATSNMFLTDTSVSAQQSINNGILITEDSLFKMETDTVLIFGGIDPYNNYGAGRNTGKDIFQYVPNKNEWEFVGEMPQPRYGHEVAFLKGRIYVVGGIDPREDDSKSVVVSTVYSFDPVSRKWYEETSLLIPKTDFGLAVCNNCIYALGGQGRNSHVLKFVEKFCPLEGSWEKRASMLTPRMGMACAKYREQIWVAGGLSENNEILDTVETYDSQNDQWSKIQKLLRPRFYTRAYVISDTMYIFGGANIKSKKEKQFGSIDEVDIWQTESSQWQSLAKLAIPRHRHSLTHFGTQLMVSGGVTSIYKKTLSNTECFCIQRGTWVRGIACLPSQLAGHSAVTLPPAMLLMGK